MNHLGSSFTNYRIASRLDEAKGVRCPNPHCSMSNQNFLVINETTWVCLAAPCGMHFTPRHFREDIPIKKMLEDQMQDRVEGKYTCDVCNEKFTTPIAKALHVKNTGHKKEV